MALHFASLCRVLDDARRVNSEHSEVIPLVFFVDSNESMRKALPVWSTMIEDI
jgi:hypothetical protein